MRVKLKELFPYYYLSHDRLVGIDFQEWVEAQGGVMCGTVPSWLHRGVMCDTVPSWGVRPIPEHRYAEISEEDLIILKLKYNK